MRKQIKLQKVFLVLEYDYLFDSDTNTCNVHSVYSSEEVAINAVIHLERLATHNIKTYHIIKKSVNVGIPNLRSK